MPQKIYPFLVLLLCLKLADAQEPISVGRGSYASKPPVGKVMDAKRGDLVAETEQRKLYLVNDDGRPIPSNKWYQNLLFQQYGTGLWAMPHKVDATKEGLEIFLPNSFSGDGTRAIAEYPLILGGKNTDGSDFQPTDSRANTWSDWMVTFRMPQDEDRAIDVTLAEGMPFVWAEFKNVSPTIAFGGLNGKGTRGKNGATFFDLQTQEQNLPATGDSLGIKYEGRHYAVFAPDGTTFDGDERGLRVKFAGKATWLVIACLPEAKAIAEYHKHTFAIPRETKLTYEYNRSRGELVTHWNVTTDALQGTNKQVLQGWLPHHWRGETAKFPLQPAAFQTIRGPQKFAIGDSFTFTYPFQGILPNWPAPGKDFDTARAHKLLEEFYVSDKNQFARDTYAGGKDLQRFAEAAFIAAQLKDSTFEPIVKKVRSELENWFTFTPGEKERYLAWYPRRKGLVGFNVSFGSQHFTDHHFHLGYFVYTVGLLSQMQPDFAAQYGDIARLVAKSYANYDRADQRFPFFRTFDIWRGHSFADGNGFPDGNNQESTGEAINSWAGMILLGKAIGDEQLTAAGVMGYVFETRANMEYWFDPQHDIFPQGYLHKACGMIWCNSIVWGTWFTASPGWIYGIQWLPSGPSLAFYDRDPKFISGVYADLERELDAFAEKEAAKKPGSTKKPSDLKSQGAELASYQLGFLMHAEPERVVNQIEKFYAEPGDKMARDRWMANLSYMANSLKTLGRVDWSCHGDSPTSMIYKNEATGTRTFIAWNPSSKPQTVTFFEGEKSLGKLQVAPHSLGSATKLD